MRAAERVAHKLRERGYQAYFVGGCVRDLLRGVNPKDHDIATDAHPDDVRALFPGSLAVGAQFGVIIVLDGDQQTEVATFRNDGLYSDGRRPDDVNYTRDPREDVLRRDFTINGLLLDPETGEVLDFVEGRRDIDRCLIRTIGNPERRFEEDRLRMLRAVRFATIFEYEIDPETAAAIHRLSPKIATVSAERVRDELVRILRSGHARRGFELLEATGLLPVILPEIAAMKGVEQPPQFHPEGDVWTHTLMMLDMLQPDCSPTLAMGVLLHDVGKPPTFRVAPDRIRFDNHVAIGARMAEQICRRLRFSLEQIAQVVSLVENHLRFADVQRMRMSTLKRFLRLPKFEEHLELHRLDSLCSNKILENYEFARAKLNEHAPEEIHPHPLIKGDDLIAMGYKPGPQFKYILHELEDAQLEQRITSRDEALDFIRERYKPE
ncbi:MAG: CCA tRNA nucleotidyltransferase [Acidobacteria bacterium]|nr:CCA tRNA nucleotidyltransferase [Acidobacteriota bacterium]